MAVVSLDVNHRRTPYVSFPDTTSDVTYFGSLLSLRFSLGNTHTLSRSKTGQRGDDEDNFVLSSSFSVSKSSRRFWFWVLGAVRYG